MSIWVKGALMLLGLVVVFFHGWLVLQIILMIAVGAALGLMVGIMLLFGIGVCARRYYKE